ALMAHLRRRGNGARQLFLLTRSSAVLDLAAMEPGETIIFCPANHSPPMHVVPHPGSPGYEAVATCLASPQVRARTEGILPWRPPATVPREFHEHLLTVRHRRISRRYSQHIERLGMINSR